MHPIDLSAVFKVLDDLHFDGLLSRNGSRIRSGCLHSAMSRQITLFRGLGIRPSL